MGLGLRLTAGQVFAAHPNIEVAVCGTVKGDVFFRQFRPNGKITSPDLQTITVMDLRSETLTEAHKRMLPYAGKAEYTIECYEKFYWLLVTEGDYFLVTVLNRDTEIQTIRDLSITMRRLLAESI